MDLTPQLSTTIKVASLYQGTSSPEIDGSKIDDKKYTSVEIDAVIIPKSSNHLNDNTEQPNANESTNKYDDCVPIFDVTRKSRLVKLLEQSINTMPTAPEKSKFSFETTIEAALNSTNQPKFEFRDQDIVSELFDLSTDGKKLKNICFKGVNDPFRKDVDMSDETRIADAEYWLAKGNNNSARGEEDLISKAITKECANSWGIVIPKSHCLSLDGAGIVPLTVASKFTKIDDNDNILYKKKNRSRLFQRRRIRTVG